MKLVCWNVNGLRARLISDVIPLLTRVGPDVVFLQEIKAQEHQVPTLFLSDLGYQSYWHSAARPGYSGVCTLSKVAPLEVGYGIGDPDIDQEGRVLTLYLPEKIALVNAYFPHSQRELSRLRDKLHFLDKFLDFILRKKSEGYKFIVGGDFNIAHQEIDLRFPRRNYENAGFLPEEREWLDKFVRSGFVDTFRIFCQEGGNFTWWSYRPGARANNVGWRIDYFFVDAALQGRITAAGILSDVCGSDHCPVSLQIAADDGETAGQS